MRKLGAILSLSIFLFACSQEDQIVYQVQDVNVDQPGAEKPSVKNSTEYISIVYSDIYGKLIPTNELEQLKTIYISFGDVGATEDLIVRNFLKDPKANIPSDTDMRKDIDKFIKDSYKKFYNREATEQEVWFHKQKIEANSDLSPQVFYYAILTSNEYRQY